MSPKLCAPINFSQHQFASTDSGMSITLEQKATDVIIRSLALPSGGVDQFWFRDGAPQHPQTK